MGHATTGKYLGSVPAATGYDVQGVPLIDMTTADFIRPITTGITTTFITARASARHMVGQGFGVILALTSGSAYGKPDEGRDPSR